MAVLNIYTDGGCRGNGSKGALGAWGVIVFNGSTKLDSFGDCERGTTNNKMELMAILQALQYIHHNELSNKYSDITIYSDSEYCIKSINTWMAGWVRKNWLGVKNTDILQPIYQLKQKMPFIKYQHVRGHQGNVGNEMVDKLCNTLMDQYSPKS